MFATNWFFLLEFVWGRAAVSIPETDVVSPLCWIARLPTLQTRHQFIVSLRIRGLVRTQTRDHNEIGLGCRLLADTFLAYYK
jgi:hypothetical protein